MQDQWVHTGAILPPSGDTGEWHLTCNGRGKVGRSPSFVYHVVYHVVYVLIGVASQDHASLSGLHKVFD